MRSRIFALLICVFVLAAAYGCAAGALPATAPLEEADTPAPEATVALAAAPAAPSKLTPAQAAASQPPALTPEPAPEPAPEAAPKAAPKALEKVKTAAVKRNTPVPTPSPEPTPTPEPKELPYYIYVEKGSYTMTVYEKDEDGEYTKKVRSYRIAHGGNKPPTGTFTIGGKERWHQFGSGGYTQYASRYHGSLYFHAPLYKEADATTLWPKYYDGELGIGGASTGGCIRMVTSAARFIYGNCPRGTVVEIVNGSPKGTTSSGVPDRNGLLVDPTDKAALEKLKADEAEKATPTPEPENPDEAGEWKDWDVEDGREVLPDVTPTPEPTPTPTPTPTPAPTRTPIVLVIKQGGT